MADSASSMLTAIVKLLTSTGHIPLFSLYLMVSIFLDALPRLILARIIDEAHADDVQFYIKCYVVVSFLRTVLDHYSLAYRRRITNDIYALFIKQEYRRYDTLSYQSRQKFTREDFQQKMRQAGNRFGSVIFGGVNNLTYVLSSGVGAVVVFYTQNIMMWLVGIVAVNIIVYRAYTHRINARIAAANTVVQERYSRDQEMIRNTTFLLEQHPGRLDELIELEVRNSRRYDAMSTLWDLFGFVTKMSNKVGYLMFLFDTGLTVQYFQLVINTITQLSSSIDNIMGYIADYTTCASYYNTYRNAWKDLEYRELLQQLDIPKRVSVSRIHVAKRLKCQGFNIDTGSKILVHGPSGGGKSTFLNALTGRIPGAVFTENVPENFIEETVYCTQEFSGNMPVNSVTLRELFGGATDEEIRWALEVVATLEILEMYGETPFDVKLDGRVSGGQRNRLALAQYIHFAIISGAKWFVLDEPEKGSDREKAVEIIQNILRAFQDVTVIIVSHLKEIHGTDIIPWDMRLEIVRGQVEIK